MNYIWANARTREIFVGDTLGYPTSDPQGNVYLGSLNVSCLEVEDAESMDLAELVKEYDWKVISENEAMTIINKQLNDPISTIDFRVMNENQKEKCREVLYSL